MVNRATHSCPPCSPSANEPPSAQCNNISYPMSLCSLFLDDVYVVVPPDRVRPVYDTLAHTLQSQASIQLNQGKTRAWNAAGIEPPNIRDLGEDVWVGNPNLPATSQGMTVLGAPIGSAAFVQHQLQQANQQHQHLLDRIPHLEDLQASWLLLFYCASPRCTYLLRMCSPNVTTEFANNHDFAVAACLRRLLAVDDLPAQALATAHLPLSQGGLGLTCASTLATPAFWSSWADSLPVLHTQLPQYAAQILEHLQHPSAAIPSIQAAAAAALALEERGWTPPSWTELTQGIQPDPTEANTEEAPRTRGWQQQATIPVHTANYNELQAAIPPASQALLQSQASPSPAVPSPPFLILQSSSTLPIFFGSSSSVVSVCTSHSQHVLVGAVALLTLLATTARHVLSQESYDPEEAPSKGQQHASAEKEGPE